MISELTIWLILVLLLVVNAAGVFLVVMQLPGTWLILLATGLMSWQQPQRITWVALLTLASLAVIGELVEFFASVRGGRKAGGTRHGAVLGLILAIVGAIVGSVFIPPIGTLIGSCLGAGIGSYMGDRIAGRSHQDAAAAGKGSAVGRLWGTIAKVLVAAAMWVVATAAVFWP